MERAHAGTLDGADVHEYVARTIGRGDEAEAFLRVKELHGTCCHLVDFLESEPGNIVRAEVEFPPRRSNT
jgi:hypothetical protein